MSQQTIKQRARRQALDVTARRRRERAERAKRLEALAVQVLTAVGERDAAVTDTERRAGTVLKAMTEVEGLTLREAVQWCGEEISVREATRLRRLAETGGEAPTRKRTESSESADTGLAKSRGATGQHPTRRSDTDRGHGHER